MKQSDLLKMRDILLNDDGFGALSRSAQIMLMQHALEQSEQLERMRNAITTAANVVMDASNSIDAAIDDLRDTRGAEVEAPILVDVSGEISGDVAAPVSKYSVCMCGCLAWLHERAEGCNCGPATSREICTGFRPAQSLASVGP